MRAKVIYPMASGMYQPKADFCGAGSAVSSQSIDRDLVKEEAERKASHCIHTL